MKRPRVGHHPHDRHVVGSIPSTLAGATIGAVAAGPGAPTAALVRAGADVAVTVLAHTSGNRVQLEQELATALPSKRRHEHAPSLSRDSLQVANK